ncbi:helix-turn-helix domain-containing protein [Candidatus Enterococcus murrayae]|uniref:Helix-turn-helix domain-containing protein n=1 Tax=Candidatus Enterococcus murrayae TaxID=2815321 RepID=A0ABS3HEX9_9ENTE|nr:helix-turn-helix domain-containing protein [Enterococcus sp. MJM16]MBO0452022.1 helix-turn-helix domain-containing protein [Enterococcus sp. MJM16]
MSQILLFTKNPLNEELFEERLRQLGHEVFTTKELIDRCLLENMNHSFIQVFHYIILSETIANAEVKELVLSLSKYKIPIFRKSDEPIEEDQLKEWKKLGITDWIEAHPSIEELREKLSSYKTRNERKIVFLPRSDEKIALSNIPLSGSELKLFLILYRQQNQTISREEISQKMWNRSKNNSTMSQLSVMIKHLKDKLASRNISGPIIETCWGRGYRLDESVNDQVTVDIVDEVMIGQQ